MKKKKTLLQQLKRQELDDNSRFHFCFMTMEAHLMGGRLDDIHDLAYWHWHR
jgi:hypothetical protein